MYAVSLLMEELADCLCETIKNFNVPDVCFCGVVPGDGVVGEYASGCSDERQGLAWVRLTSMYPANGVNVIDETRNNCGASIGIDLEVGMLRPVAVMDGFGNPPTPEEYRDAGRLMSDDAVVMRHAIQCCKPLTDLDYILGSYTPAGPEGGLVGGTWAVAVMLD